METSAERTPADSYWFENSIIAVVLAILIFGSLQNQTGLSFGPLLFPGFIIGALGLLMHRSRALRHFFGC